MRLVHLPALLPMLAACRKGPLVKTCNGTYRGRYLAEFDQDLFLGVPFAKSRVLRNPEPLDETWKGVRSAEWNGPVCYPPDELAANVTNVTAVSQGCLNLNIVRPSRASLLKVKAEDRLLPIAVWLYGGGFYDGFGADFNSNFSYLIRASVDQGMPILAVTLNYRVGVLGFPGGKEVTAAGITNIGLKDQRQALRWIQENISAFGGDPDRVTLWGQSAGAASIAYQILAYGGMSKERLFRGAIMISSSVGPASSYRSDDERQVGNYRPLLNKTGCLGTDADGDSLDCLRKIPPAELYEAGNRVGNVYTWYPSTDGGFITKPPTLQVLAGEFPRDITLLAGSNSDEGFVFSEALTAGTQDGIQTEEQLKTLLRRVMPLARPDTIDLVLRTYPVEGPRPPYAWPLTDASFCAALEGAGMKCGAQYRRVGAIMGDYGLISGRRVLARKFAEYGMPFYSYRFDTWPTSIPVVLDARKPGFASHSSEYAYFFRYPREYSLYGNNPPVAASSSAHLELSHLIPAKLIAYVYAGNPNAIKLENVPTWPIYTSQEPVNMVWNTTAEPDRLSNHIEPDTWREEGMALWAKYPLELDYIPSRNP